MSYQWWVINVFQIEAIAQGRWMGVENMNLPALLYNTVQVPDHPVQAQCFCKCKYFQLAGHIMATTPFCYCGVRTALENMSTNETDYNQWSFLHKKRQTLDLVCLSLNQLFMRFIHLLLTSSLPRTPWSEFWRIFELFSFVRPQHWANFY